MSEIPRSLWIWNEVYIHFWKQKKLLLCIGQNNDFGIQQVSWNTEEYLRYFLWNFF